MNRRALFGGLLALVSLATLWAVWIQRTELAALRADHQQLLAQLAERAPRAPAPVARDLSAGAPATLAATPELLRLRSEVTRLTERRRELEGVRADNEQLRAQLAAQRMTASTAGEPPPGYLRKSHAQLVGYNSIEDTLQSFLWALQQRDLTNLLQAFSPEIGAEIFRRASGSRESAQDFFSNTTFLVGLRIVKQEQNPSDGSVAVDLEVIPGMPGPKMAFRQINGQWKIVKAF